MAREWVHRRNCALSPAQLALWFGSIGVLSAGIAIGFALTGATLVLPFAGIEILALLTAYIVYARHAGDYERVVADSGCVIVERSTGTRCSREVYSTPWVRIEYPGGPRAPITLVCSGGKTTVGRHLPAQSRAQWAVELRRALATI